MSDLIQDLRFGVRQLWRAPGITAAALLCIGLGVGANSATFSFAHAIFLRASPAREPDRLIRIFGGWADGLRYGSFSRPDYLDLQDQNEVLEGLVAFAIAPFHL
ncbi:MAG: permease, partial [Acidobacteria bacterium]|nr:permease [Acidobacteriota bacterium]